MYNDERDAEADRQAERDRDELECRAEAGEVRRGGCLARGLLGYEGEQAAVAQAGGELEQDAGNLGKRGEEISLGREWNSGEEKWGVP